MQQQTMLRPNGGCRARSRSSAGASKYEMRKAFRVLDKSDVPLRYETRCVLPVLALKEVHSTILDGPSGGSGSLNTPLEFGA